jgi:hypothetical protein
MNTYLKRLALTTTLVSTLCLLASCGGAGSTSAQAPLEDTNQDQEETVEKTSLMLSLTDAEGDFLSYTVTVSELELTMVNGTVVQVLPEQTTVDFAQYVEISELLSVGEVPVGAYQSASLTLDYSDAEIIVQAENGDAIEAVAVDSEGATLAELEVDLEFMHRSGFVLTPRRIAFLTLDFDLDASHQIEIDGDSAQVEVSPVFLADSEHQLDKDLRVRGLLESVAESSFNIDLRPFRKREGRFGEIEVLVSDETEFEVNGEIPEDGLAELAMLPAQSAVAVLGSWDHSAREYTALKVYAGDSLPWNDKDMLRATVVGRSGNTLLVRGGVLERASGPVRFEDAVEVSIGDMTRVLKRGDTDASIADISVGSRIFATGFYDESFDATDGFVRVMLGSVSAEVVQAAPLVIDLHAINGRRVGIYDFSGTGIDEENDADPEAYSISTEGMDLSGLEGGDPIRVRGYVAEFAAAPEDYEAESLLNHTEVRAHLHIMFDLDSEEDAILSISSEALSLNLLAATDRHHVLRAGIPSDLSELNTEILVQPESEQGLFSILVDGHIEIYSHFDDFTEALAAHIEAGARLKRCDAHGAYDSLAPSISSKRIRVHLESESAD